MRFNPFRPNNIAPPGVFSGRSEEIDAIEQCLFQTKNNNPQHFLIEGERGIGKSSLLFLSETIAEGYVDDSFNFIVLTVELTAGTTFFELITKLSDQLRAELVKRKDIQALAEVAWAFVNKWSVMGVIQGLQRVS